MLTTLEQCWRHQTGNCGVARYAQGCRATRHILMPSSCWLAWLQEMRMLIQQQHEQLHHGRQRQRRLRRRRRLRQQQQQQQQQQQEQVQHRQRLMLNGGSVGRYAAPATPGRAVAAKDLLSSCQVTAQQPLRQTALIVTHSWHRCIAGMFIGAAMALPCS